MTDKQRELIDDLNLIENPQERLSVLVDRVRHLPALAAEARTESNLVPGCVSQVWLLCERDTAGRCHFRCDADGPLVKALVAFLCDYYSDCTPTELSTEAGCEDADPLAAIGLLQTLSPTRRNGLAQVRARIHGFAAEASALDATRAHALAATKTNASVATATAEANGRRPRPLDLQPRGLANNGSGHGPLLYDAHTHQPTTNGTAVSLSVLNGTHPTDWPEVAKLAAEHPNSIVPSYGLHPWYCAKVQTDWLAQLHSLLLADPRAQVGEIGLDRALLRRAGAAPIETQIAALNAQLALAAELDRVATIHCVQAHGLLLDTLRNAPKLPRLLLHCYSGSAQMIKDFAALGAYFSFEASILDPRRERLRQALRATPPDRLLIETDTPAGLSPAANALERNYWASAALLDEPVEAFTQRVAANFQTLLFR